MTQEGGSSGIWSQEIQHDALAADDDFTKFLDLDNGFDAFPQQILDHEGHSALDTPMERLAFAQNTMQNPTGHTPNMMQHMNMMNVSHDANVFTPGVQHQQFPQYQMYQQMNPNQHFQIPPTPVSNEMHAAKYVQQMENAGQMIFERNQTSFTPLVSPAQTPLDNTWNMPDFVDIDDFFSPLTSPAMEAQPTFTGASATASPIDLNTDAFSASSNYGSASKRGRRKAVQPRQVNTARSVKQSPAMKPQSKRRQFSINSLSLDKIDTMLEKPNDRLQPRSAVAQTFASSEESVSPEPLSEALMRPPPIPSNSTKSPASALRSPMNDMPATPAMLMKMPGKQSENNTEVQPITTNDEIMEDISLPDAVTVGPSQVSLVENSKLVIEDHDNTPVISAKTPKLSADSTPRVSAVRTANKSTESLDTMKRPETKKIGRGTTKRQTVPSAAVSPALRPKVSISPNISPLVPATAGHVSAETSALLLASRSNYQNILDGTHLPGVSYPEALAENLSSKRTSHKIAEQGRRNRINLALKEIEGLLPASITGGIKREKSSGGSSKENDEGSPDKQGGAGAGASKASTVEMAIVYIRSLQSELQATKKKLEAAEKTIAEGSSNGSQTSDV